MWLDIWIHNAYRSINNERTKFNMINKEKFWQWLNPDEQVFELRIKDFNIIKKTAQKYSLNYSASGLYINTAAQFDMLTKLLAKMKTTCWLSLNPKKKCFNNYGNLNYSGKDNGIYSISNILIDIDPKERFTDKDERIEQLKKCYAYASLIIDDLKKININNYTLLNSGYGVQLILKLDEDIVLPDCPYDYKIKSYTPTEEFNKYKTLIKKVFITQLTKKYNTKKFKEEYGCDIDLNCSNISRVFSCPYTFNNKNSMSVQRTVLKIQNEVKNEGLSDALLNELENLEMPIYNKQNLKTPQLKKEFKTKPSTIHDSALVKFMLTADIEPNTGINNILVFSFKCLCADNNISLNEPEVLQLKVLLEKRFNRTIAWNTPEKHFHFNPNVINNYCMEQKFTPIYEVWYNKPKRREFEPHMFAWANYKALEWEPLTLEGSTINEVLYELAKRFDGTMEQMYGFIKWVEEFKDEDYAKWFLENVFRLYVEKM